MPRTLYDESGEEVEVPTEEELNEKVADTTKLREELGIDADANISETIQQLKDDGNPNWKVMREKNEKLKTALESAGKKVNEEGNVVDNKVLSTEDIDKKISEGVNKQTFENEKARIIGKYPVENQEVFTKYLSKLLGDEEQTTENLIKYSAEAERLTFPNSNVRVNSNPRTGMPPVENNVDGLNDLQKDLGKKFGLTDEEMGVKK